MGTGLDQGSLRPWTMDLRNPNNDTLNGARRKYRSVRHSKEVQKTETSARNGYGVKRREARRHVPFRAAPGSAARPLPGRRLIRADRRHIVAITKGETDHDENTSLSPGEIHNGRSPQGDRGGAYPALSPAGRSADRGAGPAGREALGIRPGSLPRHDPLSRSFDKLIAGFTPEGRPGRRPATLRTRRA